MAAAHVTGIAALIRELGPLMSAKEVALVIRSNTRDLGAPGADAEFGTGLVDACRAAAAATADAVSCRQGGERVDLSAY
jgi:subtilisin family serine protease